VLLLTVVLMLLLCYCYVMLCCDVMKQKSRKDVKKNTVEGKLKIYFTQKDLLKMSSELTKTIQYITVHSVLQQYVAFLFTFGTVQIIIHSMHPLSLPQISNTVQYYSNSPSTVVLVLYYFCLFSNVHVYSGCIPGVFRVYSGCIPGVFRVYSGCITGVLRVYYGCITGVLRVYYRSV
jgi:hypothetical protein